MPSRSAQVFLIFHNGFHDSGVFSLVGLRPQGPNSWASGAVENALLEVSTIRDFANFTAKRVYFVGELRLGRATDGRVTGLPCDAIKVHGE